MKTNIGIVTAICLLLSGFARSQCNIPDNLFENDSIVVCFDSTTILETVPLHGVSYSWSTNESSSNSVKINRSGKYWVRVSNGACTKSDTVTVLFNSFVLS